MELRRLQRDALRHENGLDAERLLPWPALNAPFEGSWCVIRPGTASTAHSHHEYEIFIAIRGRAWVESGGIRESFVAGDIVHFPPHVEHRVLNENQEDFEMYSIWWDGAMAQAFSHRHAGGRP